MAQPPSGKQMNDIASLIPHRPPMLLVDEIISEGEGTLTAAKTFRADEFFFQGHYPDFPIVPGVILCECALQTGAVLISKTLSKSSDNASTASHVPMVTRLNDVKFKRAVHPGERIEMEVTLDDAVARAMFFSAKIRCEGKLAVSLTFAATLVPRGEP